MTYCNLMRGWMIGLVAVGACTKPDPNMVVLDAHATQSGGTVRVIAQWQKPDGFSSEAIGDTMIFEIGPDDERCRIVEPAPSTQQSNGHEDAVIVEDDQNQGRAIAHACRYAGAVPAGFLWFHA